MKDIFLRNLHQLEASKFHSTPLGNFELEHSLICPDDGVMYAITTSRKFIEYTWDQKSLTAKGLRELDTSDLILEQQQIASLIYNRYDDTLLIVLSDGGLFYVNLLKFELEELGEQEGGFLAAEISPCGEIIVFVTGQNTVMSFSKEMTPIDSKPLEDAADESSSSEELGILDAQIVWRSDSNYFCINYSIEGGRKCVTKDKYLASVISPAKPDPDDSKTLVRSVAFDKIQNMGSCLTWMPNNSLIMAPQIDKKTNRLKIINWEKNGLIRNDFDLSPSVGDILYDIHQLAWDPLNRILIIRAIAANGTNYIFVYTCSNYEWYCKNIIPFKNRIIACNFSNRKADQLFIAFANGDINVLTFIHDYNVGEVTLSKSKFTTTSYSKSLACFVDGNVLRITALAQQVVPPPMSMFKEELPGQIILLGFERDLIAALTLNSMLEVSLSLLHYDDDKQTVSKLSSRLESNELQNIVAFSHLNLCIVEKGVVHFRVVASGPSTSSLFGGEIHFNFCEQKIELRNVSAIEEDVNYSLSLVYAGEFKYFKEYQKINVHALELDYTQRVKRSVALKQSGELIVFSLLHNDHLMKNSTCISKNCTSFQVTERFLLFTTMTQGMYDQLVIYPLDLVKDACSEIDEAIIEKKKKSHYYRNIERSSVLVAVSGEVVIVQHSRGNLEGFYPKLLLFFYLQDLVQKEKRYLKAYKEIRRHKLDVNLLIDLSPEGFEEYLTEGEFCKKFRNIDYVNLIINSLEEDICPDLKYLYPADELAIKSLELKNRVKESKINYFCDKIKEALLKEKNYFIFSIMVAFAKKTPPELKEALDMIKGLISKEEQYRSGARAPHISNSNQKGHSKSTPSAKKVLEYLCWVADPNHLYEVALMTYDLELALMVAEFTNKDPSEYIPYIQKLRDIEDPINRHFSICFDTKNFEQGIRELSKGDEDQINRSITIAIEKKLFVEAMAVYSSNHEALAKLSLALGNHLYASSQYRQAATLLVAGGDSKTALECHKKSLDWRAGLAIMQSHLNEYTAEDIKSYLEEMKAAYIASKNYREAADIAISQGAQENSEEVIELAIVKGNDFKLLKRLGLDFIGDSKKIANQICPKLQLHAEIELTKLDLRKKEYSKRIDRLKTVKQLKKNAQFFNLGEQVNYDTQSEMSYGSQSTNKFSVITGASGMSKKTMRPTNLKTRKVKEGSLFEEEYLVECLNSEELSNEEKSSLRHFLDCLVTFGMAKQAGEIVIAAQDFEKHIKKRGKMFKTLEQEEFEEKHPELYDIYGHLREFQITFEEKKKKKGQKEDPLDKFKFLTINNKN